MCSRGNSETTFTSVISHPINQENPALLCYVYQVTCRRKYKCDQAWELASASCVEGRNAIGDLTMSSTSTHSYDDFSSRLWTSCVQYHGGGKFIYGTDLLLQSASLSLMKAPHLDYRTGSSIAAYIYESEVPNTRNIFHCLQPSLTWDVVSIQIVPFYANSLDFSVMISNMNIWHIETPLST